MYKIYFIYKMACINKDVKSDSIMITEFIVKLERQSLYTFDNQEKLFGNICICMAVQKTYLYIILKCKKYHKWLIISQAREQRRNYQQEPEETSGSKELVRSQARLRDENLHVHGEWKIPFRYGPAILSKETDLRELECRGRNSEVGKVLCKA